MLGGRVSVTLLLFHTVAKRITLYLLYMCAVMGISVSGHQALWQRLTVPDSTVSLRNPSRYRQKTSVTVSNCLAFLDAFGEPGCMWLVSGSVGMSWFELVRSCIPHTTRKSSKGAVPCMLLCWALP